VAGQVLLGEHGGRLARRLHPPVHEEHQLGRVLGGQGQVVHGGQHGQSPGPPQFLDQVQHLLLAAHVQGGGGLVEQQHGRLLGQRPGQDGALPLAPGQRAHRPRGQRRQLQVVQHVVHHRQVLLRLYPERPDVGRAAEQDVVDDPQRGRDQGVLGHQRQRTGPGASPERGDRPSADRDGPLEPGRPREGPQERRLAGAVRPHDGHPAAGRHAERHAVDDGPAAQADGDVAAVEVGAAGRHRTGAGHWRTILRRARQ